MNRRLDPTIDRLQRTFLAVAEQLVDEPPAFVAVPVTPTPAPGRRRALLVAAACVVAIVAGAIAIALTRDSGRGHTPVIDEPSVPTTTPTTARSTVEHLVPGPGGTITAIALQSDAANPQPLEYQLGYAGTVEGRPAQLMITADDFSRTRAPNFTLENHGCDTNGDGSPRFRGTIVPFGDHQACLVTNIQAAIHLGWIDTDGVSVLIQGSGLSVEQIEAVGASVERVPGDPLALRLRDAPPAGLTLVGEGRKPQFSDVWITFDQGSCRYALSVRRADPVPFSFDPYASSTTVRGHEGRIQGVSTTSWLSGDTLVTLGGATMPGETFACPLDPGIAESLVAIDEAEWQRLLADHDDIVEHQGG